MTRTGLSLDSLGFQTIGLVAGACLALSACFPKGGSGPGAGSGGQRRAADMPLEMPRNWNDRVMDVAPGKTKKTVVAVLAFDVRAAGPAAANLRAHEMIATALQKTGRFEIVEREKLASILAEQKLKLSGAIDDASKVAEIGKLAGAEAVIFGSVTSATQQKIDKFGYDLVRTEVRIDTRAADSTTAKVMFTEAASGIAEAKVVTDARGQVISGAVSFEAEYPKAAANAVDRLGKKLAGLFSVMGYVVNVDKGVVMTDLGASRGLEAGDALVVFRPGEKIMHPVTKKVIAWKKELLDVAEVAAVEKDTSTARLLRKGAGSGSVKAGDAVVVVPRF